MLPPIFCISSASRTNAQGWRGVHAADDRSDADVAPIHDRQMVILDRSDWSAWLQEQENEKELLRALPAGSLEIEQVR